MNNNRLLVVHAVHSRALRDVMSAAHRLFDRDGNAVVFSDAPKGHSQDWTCGMILVEVSSVVCQSMHFLSWLPAPVAVFTGTAKDVRNEYYNWHAPKNCVAYIAVHWNDEQGSHVEIYADIPLGL